MRPEDGVSFSRSNQAQALTSQDDARDLLRAEAPRVSRERPPKSLTSRTEFRDVHYRRRDQLCRSW